MVRKINQPGWIDMLELIHNQIIALGISGDFAMFLARGIMSIGVLLLAAIGLYLSRRILLSFVASLFRKTQNNWDDILVRERILDRASHIIPLAVVHIGSLNIFYDRPILLGWIDKICFAYLVLICLWVSFSILNGLQSIYQRFELARAHPIKSYLQVLKICLSLVALILVLSSIFNQSPVVLLSGLGAMTAVLLLIFRDSILGFVASIQISANNMLREGDWIEMQKYGADGNVIDISLTTIKIQNWDKTITSIPSYAFIQDSFRNWRGMSESGGRRIKRSLEIDMHSVHFCSPELLERLAKIDLLTGYLQRKREEIKKYNQERGVVDDSMLNGRRLTNLGTFRAYIKAYLENNPNIHQGMTLIVRQLAPSGTGIPLEIYCFSKLQAWDDYERVQSDIFDHLLAVIGAFELSVYQQPSGRDFGALAQQRALPA